MENKILTIMHIDGTCKPLKIQNFQSKFHPEHFMNTSNALDCSLVQWLESHIDGTNEFLPPTDDQFSIFIDDLLQRTGEVARDPIQRIRIRLETPIFDTVKDHIISYYVAGGCEVLVCNDNDRILVMQIHRLSTGEYMSVFCRLDSSADSVDIINITITSAPPAEIEDGD